jgi:hypothetical protein
MDYSFEKKNKSYSPIENKKYKPIDESKSSFNFEENKFSFKEKFFLNNQKKAS